MILVFSPIAVFKSHYEILTPEQMKSCGGFPVPIPPLTNMPHGKAMDHKLASGLFMDITICAGKKSLSHSSGSMALLVVEKPFCRKFPVFYNCTYLKC